MYTIELRNNDLIEYSYEHNFCSWEPEKIQV